jgi:hypothetical protein
VLVVAQASKVTMAGKLRYAQLKRQSSPGIGVLRSRESSTKSESGHACVVSGSHPRNRIPNCRDLA